MIAETSPRADSARASRTDSRRGECSVVDRRFDGPLVATHPLSPTIAVASRNLPTWMRPEILATVVTSFCTFGITAVQGILLARMLGPEGRGQFGTAIFYSTTLTFIGMAGAQYAIARRAAKNPGDSLQLSQSALRLAVLTGLGTFALVAILSFTSLPLEKRFLGPLCMWRDCPSRLNICASSLWPSTKEAAASGATMGSFC